MSQVPPPPGGGSYTPPPSGASAGGSDRTLMVALSYLWILALIPLLTKKDDREIQWHAKNGLAILVAEIAAWVVLTIISFALPSGLMMTLNCAVWIGFLVLRIVCIVKGVNGQRFRVPVVSDFADKF